MKQLTCLVLLPLFWGIIASAEETDLIQPMSSWSVRYAQMSDQRPEWDTKGYLPSYQIVWGDREKPDVRIEDHKDGRCRGFAILGREYQMPAEFPRDLRLAVEYQTYCDYNRPEFKHAGTVYFMFLTPEQWAAYADEPAMAKNSSSTLGRGSSVHFGTIHRSPDDATEWAEFTTGNLKPFLRPLAGKNVVLALAWGCAHFNVVERGAFRNVEFKVHTEEDMVRDFFDALDYELPELARVKVAYEAGDVAAAKAALVEHMKMRTKPVPPILHSRSDERSVAAANKLCDHVFRFVGCPDHKIGETILWNEDPFDYDQWAIALNRHTHWLTLGRVYTGTKNEKFSREWVAQLRSWIDAMPVRIGRHYVQGVTPECTLSLDAGIRMGQSWFPTYYHFLHSPSFSVDDHVAMLRSFRDHAVYLMDPRHFKQGSNWGMMELNGLYHIGVMLPEFKDAGAWRDTAIERLAGELDYQFYPDGAQTELAPGYHGVSVRNALNVFDLAKHTGDEVPPELLGKLERTFDYYQRIMMPDGRVPNLNDSSRGSARSWLDIGLRHFPNRQDWRYGATDAREGSPPDYTSCKLDWAGWYVMRTGWNREARYLLFDAGPFSTGHQHEDKLHFILYAHGRQIVTDPGMYSYDRSAWRHYTINARSHNTVLVDGMEQRRRGQAHTNQNEKPQTNRWITSSSFDYAEGTYSDGFGDRHDKTVTHTRRILFVKPRYWIVVDEMNPSDEEEHSYETLFQLDAPDALIDERTRSVTTTNPAGGNVAIVPLNANGMTVCVVKGQKEPFVQGWKPTGKHNELLPIPTAIFERTATGITQAAYVFVPFEGAAADVCPTITPLTEDGGNAAIACQIAFPDGATHILAMKNPTATAMSVAGHSTDAEMLLIAGPEKTFTLGGARLEREESRSF